jgi:hypothetical protein
LSYPWPPFTIQRRFTASTCRLKSIQGAVLILCTLRSLLWNTSQIHKYQHYLQPILGLGFSLLGLLDIGNHSITLDSLGDLDGSTPMYTLIGRHLPLVIVGAVYVVAYFGGTVSSPRDKARADRWYRSWYG